MPWYGISAVNTNKAAVKIEKCKDVTETVPLICLNFSSLSLVDFCRWMFKRSAIMKTSKSDWSNPRTLSIYITTLTFDTFIQPTNINSKMTSITDVRKRVRQESVIWRFQKIT